MLELQVLAALLALERAREQARVQMRRLGGPPVLATAGAFALGWIVRAGTSRSAR